MVQPRSFIGGQEVDKEVRGEDDPPGVQAPGGVPGGAGGAGRGGGGAPEHLLCRGEEAAVQHQGHRGQQGEVIGGELVT